MPEWPDISVYVEALERRILGQVLEAIRLQDMFVLRTYAPPLDGLAGRRVTAVRRIGQRIALGFENDNWLVMHLMIASRLQWTPAPDSGRAGAGAKPRTANALAHFTFPDGTLTLTEAGSKRRASLHVVADAAGLTEPGRGRSTSSRRLHARLTRAERRFTPAPRCGRPWGSRRARPA